ncbi:ferrochelatase [Acetobacteraceae bacterium H6797]|nr:ferrochelatase [Acetobacteraceae bacterium H6797]
MSPLPPNHPAVLPRRVGVLLVNLGTPDGTDYWSMRRYLKEFLEDRRVIEVNRALWWFILNVIILTKRPGAKGKDYEKIWDKARNESPLRTITRAQAEALPALIDAGARGIVVDWAMRYGTPSIASRMKALQDQGCDRILVVPLYPQAAAATSATVADEAFRHLMKQRWQPALRIAAPWHDDGFYIEALARSVESGLAKLDFEPEVILASFHGVPEYTLREGDPYHCFCLKTARLLRERLGMSKEKLLCTFQSRFGRDPWVQPYTDKTIEALAQKGVKRMAILAPGFVADCLETLEELDGENREIFEHNGGEKFAYIPCLNASEDGMEVIRQVVEREISGWA